MIKTLGEDLTVEEARRIADESKARLKAEERSSRIKGILINRDPPISTGWCGYDECLHTTHVARRAAQAAADTRANR